MFPRILNYNINSVTEYFKKQKAREILPFLGDPRVFSKYEKFGMNKNPVYDRSGAIPHYLNMAPIHPMPNFDNNYNKSFYEVAKERAKEIVSLNKPIKVCWSGGVDSTFVLCILSEYASQDQITVYGTYGSIIESGDIYDKFIKQKFKTSINIYPNREMKTKIEDCVWVTGFQGNQLFGPTDNFFSVDKQVSFFHHTMGKKETIYEDYKKHIDADLLHFLQPAIDRSPRKLETVADIRWYCIFNFDWYNGKYALLNEMNKQKIKDIYHFFDTEEFEKWAVHTKDPWTKIPGNPNTHRWQMRDYMSDMGLELFARNKSKSISSFSFNKGNWLFVLENYENIYATYNI